MEQKEVSGATEEAVSLDRMEEELDVGTATAVAGRVRARKQVEREEVEQVVPVQRERLRVDRAAAAEGDSGEIEIMPDGSISIPLLSEELVVAKRVVVRERVVLRKGTVTEEEVVHEELLRERVEVEADEAVADYVDGADTIAEGGGDTSSLATQVLPAMRRPFVETGETKPAFRTTELLAFVAAVTAILVAAWLLDDFEAPAAWLLIAALAAGYALSRGFAKLGTGARVHDDDRGD